MALMKSGEAVPKDAVVLNEQKAVEYIWDLIFDWQPASDTWALRHGATVLGFINAASGLFMNKHFRHKLKLGNYGFYSSVIPLTLMPGLLTALFHRHTVATNILLDKSPVCPICYEIRSAAVQTTFGMIYPMVLAPTTALMLANRYCTARVPHLKEGFSVMLNFLRKTTRPFNGTLVTLLTIQLVASSVLTYFEIRNHVTVKNKLIDLERKLTREDN